MRLALNGQVKSVGVYATFHGKAVNSIPFSMALAPVLSCDFEIALSSTLSSVGRSTLSAGSIP